MLQENIKARGLVTFALMDENGNLKESQTHNLVVTSGLGYITSRMRDATATVMSHMAVGTGSVAAALANTTLGSEIAGSRQALTSTTIVTTTNTNDSIQYVGTFGAGVGTGAITEAGIFNAASAGTMLARTVFATINKGANDTLTITWKITVA